ncbi:hypothetical protein NKR19_g2189 [Coniochaeta hoffmannii]|uniref:Uncharacterized protein n=1 Tax=Coniochaeta hoffmannii TaxID=91930 RepID=A0AA38RZC9_9PEZI|nr:hypothetical protein NKR19_g2189 [Coniochaeta hoffmannii]
MVTSAKISGSPLSCLEKAMHASPSTGSKIKMDAKTYNIRDSPVVTHPSTSLTITSLSRGERTGSRVLWYLWSAAGISTANAGATVAG